MGRRSGHSNGIDVLGSDNRVIVIRFKDAVATAKKMDARAAAVALIAPQTLAAKVYDETAKQLHDKFAEQGVDVDVQVVADPNSGPPRSTEFLPGVIVGAVLPVVGYGIYRLVTFLMHRGRS